MITIIPDGKGKGCVCLLSGGLDSSTLAWAVKKRNWLLNCITFIYGQKHKFEITAAKKVARKVKCSKHILFKMDLDKVAKSALTTEEIAVPLKNRFKSSKRIPPTYVPARNLIFLSIATSWAESIGVKDIFIAVNAIDYSGYPDCREKFIKRFESAVNSGTKAGEVEGKRFKIHSPFVTLTKAQIIKLGMSIGVDYSITHSCYNPDKNAVACGRCDACHLRLKGFRKAGYIDPLKYQMAKK